jgi:hypothetical protein
MVHTRQFISIKDQEGHLSLKLLVGNVRFKKIINSIHANNMPRGGSLVFGVKIRV